VCKGCEASLATCAPAALLPRSYGCRRPGPDVRARSGGAQESASRRHHRHHDESSTKRRPAGAVSPDGRCGARVMRQYGKTTECRRACCLLGSGPAKVYITNMPGAPGGKTLSGAVVAPVMTLDGSEVPCSGKGPPGLPYYYQPTATIHRCCGTRRDPRPTGHHATRSCAEHTLDIGINGTAVRLVAASSPTVSCTASSFFKLRRSPMDDVAFTRPLQSRCPCRYRFYLHPLVPRSRSRPAGRCVPRKSCRYHT